MEPERTDSDEWQGSRRVGDEDDHRPKLTARQDTSQRLPRSDDLNETTLMAIDSGPATGSRPSSGTRPPDQLSLPSLAAQTSSDEAWSSSNLPPVDDQDTSSVKSNNSVSSSAAIPARLPALGVRQGSKDELKTDVETDKPAATDELGSVESIRMVRGSQSGRLASVSGAPAWTKEKIDPIAVNDDTKKPLDDVPADAADDDSAGHEDLQEVEPTSTHHAEDTTTDDAQHPEIITTSSEEPATTVPDDAQITHALEDDAVLPENVQTSVDSSAENDVDGQPGNEVEAQRDNVEEQTQEEQPAESPGENDSGVNVEDVNNDEVITDVQDQVTDAVQGPPASTTVPPVPETPAVDAVDVAFTGDSLIKITPPDDDVSSPPSRQQQDAANADSDRLSVRKSPNLSARRRSSFDARDLRHLQRGDEGGTDGNKPRLVALAQKGEWSVLDQILRAMERSSFYEVNLADEVCFAHFQNVDTGMPLNQRFLTGSIHILWGCEDKNLRHETDMQDFAMGVRSPASLPLPPIFFSFPYLHHPSLPVHLFRPFSSLSLPLNPARSSGERCTPFPVGPGEDWLPNAF